MSRELPPLLRTMSCMQPWSAESNPDGLDMAMNESTCPLLTRSTFVESVSRVMTNRRAARCPERLSSVNRLILSRPPLDFGTMNPRSIRTALPSSENQEQPRHTPCLERCKVSKPPEKSGICPGTSLSPRTLGACHLDSRTKLRAGSHCRLENSALPRHGFLSISRFVWSLLQPSRDCHACGCIPSSLGRIIRAKLKLLRFSDSHGYPHAL
jgi:hypothetical protein